MSDTKPEDSIKIEEGQGNVSCLTYPEGGYGWVIVLASFLVHTYAIGFPTTFGIYQENYISDPPFAGNFSVVAITFIGSVGSCGVGLFAFPAGRLTDLFGHRLMCAIGAVIMSLSLLGASFATEYWHFLLFQGAGFALGSAFAYFPVLTIISHYFKKKIGIAVGIAVAGSGLGGLVLAPVTRFLISEYGLRANLRMHAGASGVLVLICSMLLVPRMPKSIRGQMNYREVLTDKRFLLLFAVAVAASFGYFIPFFFIPSYARFYGISRSDGALIVGLTNGASALGRIVWGLIADKTGHVNMLFMCMFVSSLSLLLIWPFAFSFGLLAFFGIVYGFFIGGYISLLPTAIRILFGSNNISTITGMVYSGFFLGNLLGSPVAAAVLELLTVRENGAVVSINFLPTILVAGFTLLMAALLIFRVKLVVGKGKFWFKT